MKFLRFIIIFVCLLPAAPRLQAATVTLDSTKQYQTIEGMGTAVASHMLSLHNNSRLIKQLVNDLGVSMVRIYPPPTFEPVNDNPLPDYISWEGFDFYGQNDEGPVVHYQMEVIKKFKAMGMDRVILSVFSPPDWMKTSESPIGGELKKDMHEEFAEYYSAYVQGVKEKTGVDVYAISPQNEPRWEQWYDSCVYTYSDMAKVINVLGQRFERDSIDVKIFAAEDLMGEDWIQWTQPWTDYYHAMMDDPVAASYCDVVAVHTYEDGVQPSSPSAKVWQEVATAADTVGKAVWMTETSGYDDSWEDAFSLARAIYSALHYGNCGAWVWLNAAMRRQFNPHEGLVIYENNNSFSYQHKYYTVKQYFRYIRPDAVRIEARSDDTSLHSLAFEHEEDQTLTLVLLNQSMSKKRVFLTGMDCYGFEGFRSSRSENCESIGMVSDSLDLPGMSITTLMRKGAGGATSGSPLGFKLEQNYPNPFNPATTIDYILDDSRLVELSIFSILGEHVNTLFSGLQNAGRHSIIWDGKNREGIRQSSGSYFCRLRIGDESEVRRMILLN